MWDQPEKNTTFTIMPNTSWLAHFPSIPQYHKLKALILFSITYNYSPYRFTYSATVWNVKFTHWWSFGLQFSRMSQTKVTQKIRAFSRKTLPPSSTLKMEAVCSYKICIPTIWHGITTKKTAVLTLKLVL